MNRQLIQTCFFEAAGHGTPKSVVALLADGAEIDGQDYVGDTALHLAVRHGQAATAAHLMLAGASHDIVNRQGFAAFSPGHAELELLHAIRQHYHRIRSTPAPGETFSFEQTSAWARDLADHGIVKLPEFIDQHSLSRLRADFRDFVDALNRKILRREGSFGGYDEEEHWWPADRAYISNNAFKYSRELVRICCRQSLLELARHAVGKAPIISRAVAMRYLPDVEKHSAMFGWHHDMEDRRLKAFILLTDIGPHDQYMSYVRGSHVIFHPLEMFRENRCSLDYCRAHLGHIEIANTFGRAGDVYLFDSNGAHRGNRKPNGAVRDAFFVEFTSDSSDVWGGDIIPGSFEGIEFSADNPFDLLISAEKKWCRAVQRTAPTWIENLPHVDLWR